MAEAAKAVRQSVSLPSGVARRVQALAKRQRTSANRVIVELIETGLEAREREKKTFFALAERLAHSSDASEQRMRRIFLYVGMLVPPKVAGGDFRAMDVDQFAERYEKSVASRKEKGEPPTGFFEREIARRTDCFGNICQVFSTYESRHAASDATPFQRGINSIQLLRDGNRWWIASVVWDLERPDNPIPTQYLSAK